MESPQVTVDQEFKSLISSLDGTELEELTEGIKRDGCRDPLVVWQEKGILLDGHHRQAICQKLGKPYQVVYRKCDDRNDAMAFIIKNQFARRNLNDFQRVELTEKLEPLLEEQAQKRELSGKRASSADPVLNSTQGRTREKLATIAGVSPDTVRKVKKIKGQAAPAVEEMARKGEVSIDAAAQVATLPKAEQKKVAKKGPAAVKAKAKAVREGEPEQPEITEDELGQHIEQASIREAFAIRRDLLQCILLITQLKISLRVILNKPGAAFFEIQEMDTLLDNARSYIKLNAPYAICRICGGPGCVACRKSGYISRFVYNTVPVEMRVADPKGTA